MALKNETYIQCTGEPVYGDRIHNAIIQTLDRHLGYDINRYPLFFPSTVYEAALKNATDVDIIFAQSHPNFELYDVNPEQAVREVGGQFAGKLRGARVDKIGHPAAMGELALSANADIEQLIKEGKLSLSPSLGIVRDTDGNIVKARLQNILLFPELVGGPMIPGDPGTRILNNRPNPLHKKPTIKTDDLMTEKPDGAQAPVDLASLAEMVAQFTASSKKAEEEKAQFTAMLAAKDKELADFRASIAKQEADRKDAEFKALIQDPNFPTGLKAGEGFEATLRAEFEASPVQFTKKVVTAMATLAAPLPGEQGAQFAKQSMKKHTDAEIEIFKKFGLKESEYPEA
jgi:hypothetical protein